ncbi:class B sortase [Romboutsia sp. 1001713B170207_170306_H8]|uniref:class B sortase n=1 Tax=Romboutsia sp. 1001713B170207_170306_H8 TaxID=2787112 RepID=UPI0008207045|nr:class B sortase [Romboutsia sp. 1001713B170207_170306_H8]SCI49529.1 Sortase (surface protein transpeptidase) [uncultured Clostridium sp.]
MRKFLRTLINLILISILVLSGYKIYTKLSEYKKADKVYTEIREKSKKSNKDEELSSSNPDYRFWLKVDNTNIDYPVVQGTDNDYYLTHDFNKDYLASGSIFMDYRNDFENDKSIIIYGHHMRNKTMFGELANFKEESFFNENNKITIEHQGKTYTYEVFSVYIADSSENFLETNFNNDTEYQNYINEIKNKSLFKTNTNVTFDDKIITLYTCSYEFNGARTIVNAKLTSIS